MSWLGTGSRIGGYEIVAPLRAGGMASFYLARRVGPAGFVRPVGIKVVHAHLTSDRSFVEMFLDEARLSARIVHPNVVHVEELGESDGVFFLAMELVHGAPLSSLLRKLGEQQRVLDPAMAVAIAMRVADGLHAAHEVTDDAGKKLDVVHRDVSPQNILVGADGRVKLIDFGIAKARGRMQETEGGSIKGKLRYMSPEQAWGRPIDRRTDVYALGIVLWEALTGRRLFGGDTDVDALERVRAPVVPDASTFEAAVPPALDVVLRTALAREASERFETAQAFRRALGAACPAAATIEPDDIGALVRTLLADDLARERSLLAGFEELAPAPHASDAVRAERAMHETRRVATDAPAASIAQDAATRASSPRAIEAAVPPPPRRAPWPAVLGIGVIALAIAGAAFVFSGPREPAAAPRSASSAPVVVGPCDAVVHVPAGEGAAVIVPFDTRTGVDGFVLPEMRNTAVPPIRSVVFSYVVPGTGQRSVEIDTALPATDARFDTMVAVFHGACSSAMATRAPDQRIDDEEDEFRARGGIRAQAGEELTLVLTGYGGQLAGRIDDGPGAISIRTRDVHPPTLDSAEVSMVGSILSATVHGADDDGDATALRLRIQGREGSPIAMIDLDELVDHPGPFTATGTLDVGEQGQRNIMGATQCEITVLDRDGNASPPLEVAMTTRE